MIETEDNMGKQRLVLILLGILLLITTPSQRLGSAGVPGEGDWWLKSNEDVRQTYTGAFVLGFGKGYGLGCSNATKNLPPDPGLGLENNPRHECLQQEPNFSVDTALIAKSITEFYQRFPDNRDVYVEEIIVSLAEGQTLDEIHQLHSPAKNPR
jgi:hypothetical protein